MIKTETSMDLNYFNDFYILETLKAEISQEVAYNPRLEFSHSVTKLREDIQEFCDILYPNLALRTFVYLFAACTGESRHATDTAARDFYLEEVETASRESVFRSVCGFSPSPENIQALIDVFSQDWRSGFGGQNWKDIARALKMYFSVPPATFLDHVIDLEHNNGTVFSKSESEHLKFIIKYSGNFSHFLDCKFRFNLLKYNIGQELIITHKVRAFIARWEVLFSQKAPAQFQARLPSLTDYSVAWGEKRFTKTQKWHKWAACSYGNLPNLRWLMHTLTRKIWPAKLIRKQLKNEMKQVKKAGLTDLQDKKYHKDWKKLVNKYYENYKKDCLLPKQKITYPILPVKIKRVGYNLRFQIPVPYYGYGRQTDYGFVFIALCQGIFVGPGPETGFDGAPGFHNAVITRNDSVLRIIMGTNTFTWQDNKLEAIIT